MKSFGTVKRKSRRKKKLDYSKALISDIRSLLWVVTIGGFLLAFYCVTKGYTASLPWISSMVGLPWAAHGTVCSFYLRMAQSDHSVGGITFEAAKANEFIEFSEDDINSPPI